MDRSADFRGAVRNRMALLGIKRHGHQSSLRQDDAVKGAAAERVADAFTTGVVQLNNSIAKTKDVMQEVRPSYLRLVGGLTEQQRSAVDTSLMASTRRFEDRIRSLEALLKSQRSSFSSDVVAHRAATLLCLGDSLASLQDQMKDFQVFREKAQKIGRLGTAPSSTPALSASSPTKSKSGTKKTGMIKGVVRLDKSLYDKDWEDSAAEDDELDQGQLQAIQTEKEQRALASDNEVVGAQRRMHEISKLSAVLALRLGEQTQRIESLYQDSVDSLHNVAEGNVALSNAKSRMAKSGVTLFLMFVIASLILLMLDWIYD